MSSAEAKVVILGSGGVGKSALCIQFTKGKYVERYDPTIEDSYRKQIEVDGQARMLDILDTAGQEEYTAMRTQYMKSGQGFVIVYAVDDQDSFSEATAIWDQIVKTKDTSKVPCVLVGNKCDLVASVPRADAEAFAAEKNIAFLEASAKEKINVDEIFTTLVRKINEILGGGPAPAPAAAEPTTAEVASSSAPATGGSAPAEAPKAAAPAAAPAKPKKKKGLCMIL